MLADSRIQIYGCGRADVRSGQIDRRVLATMMYLAASGLKPTITSLRCGHGNLTTPATCPSTRPARRWTSPPINGIVITPATQGAGSITDVTIQALLKLQGTMKPHQIISLMTFGGADNTLRDGRPRRPHPRRLAPALRPEPAGGKQIDAVLKPDQWIKLIDRLGNIDNPTVSTKPSRFATKVHRRDASQAHRGE